MATCMLAHINTDAHMPTHAQVPWKTQCDTSDQKHELNTYSSMRSAPSTAKTAIDNRPPQPFPRPLSTIRGSSHVQSPLPPAPESPSQKRPIPDDSDYEPIDAVLSRTVGFTNPSFLAASGERRGSNVSKDDEYIQIIGQDEDVDHYVNSVQT